MQCYGLKGAFQHPDVRIGWAPFICLQETEIRSNPGGGVLLKGLFKSSGVGYQSVRNPNGSSYPSLRAPVIVNGHEYSWVYSRAGTHTGWIRRDHIAPDLNSSAKPPLLGPGGFDFEIGRTQPLPKKPSGCGKQSLSRPIKTVVARDTYLRYSPRGTAFHYLHKGDKVKLYLVNGPHGFAFGEVVYCQPNSAVKVGSRGWLLHEVLE